jgi:hypothetical protein
MRKLVKEQAMVILILLLLCLGAAGMVCKATQISP